MASAVTVTLAGLSTVGTPPAVAALPSQCVTSAAAMVTCTFQRPGSSFTLTIPDGTTSAHLHVVGAEGQASRTILGTSLSGIPGGRPAVVDADIATSVGDQLVILLRDNGGYGRFAAEGADPTLPASGSGGGSSAVQRAAGQGGELIAEAGGGGGGGLVPDKIAAAGSAGGDAGAAGQPGPTEGSAVVAATGGGPGLATGGSGGAGATVDADTPAARTFGDGAPGTAGLGGLGGDGDLPGGGGGGGTTGGGGGGAGGTGSTGRAFGAGGGGGSSTVPAGGTLAVSPEESALVRITFTLDTSTDYAPTSLDFGPVLVGSASSRRTVSLTNTGAADLVTGTGSVSGSADFFVATDDCSRRTLHPGSSCQVTLYYRPSARGPASATFSLPDSTAGSPHVTTLVATGVAPVATVAPQDLGFETRETGTQSPPQTVTLTNTGDGDLTVSWTTIKVDPDFLITSDTCSDATITPHGSCAVSVAFRPRTAGLHSGELRITHNAGSATVVALHGIATPPADLKVLGVGSAYTGRDHLVTRAVPAPGKVQAFPLVILNEDTVARAYLVHLDSSGFPSTSEVRNSITGAVLPVSGPGTYVTATVQPGKTVSYSLRVTPTGTGLGTSHVRVMLQSDIGATIESLDTETNIAAPANGTSSFELFARQGSQPFVGGPTAGQTTTGPALAVGGSAAYTVRLRNNGSTATPIGLRLTDLDGCAGSFTVAASAGGKVRTADAYAGTFLTPALAPGGYQDVQVSIRRVSAGCRARTVRAESLDHGVVRRTSYLLANAAYDATAD